MQAEEAGKGYEERGVQGAGVHKTRHGWRKDTLVHPLSSLLEMDFSKRPPSVSHSEINFQIIISRMEERGDDDLRDRETRRAHHVEPSG